MAKGERVARKVVAGKPYRFNTLNQYLRQGLTPEKLGGVILGAGVCKAAYRFTLIDRMTGNTYDVAIKLNAQGGMSGDSTKFPEELKAAGGIPVKSTLIGRYVMQELVTPFAHAAQIPDKAKQQLQEVESKLRARHQFFDIHYGNVGFNADGDLRIFDW